MADKSLKLSIVVAAQDLASGKLGKVRSELSGMSRAGKAATLGLGSLTAVGNKVSGAFGRLRIRSMSTLDASPNDWTLDVSDSGGVLVVPLSGVWLST